MHSMIKAVEIYAFLKMQLIFQRNFFLVYYSIMKSLFFNTMNYLFGLLIIDKILNLLPGNVYQAPNMPFEKHLFFKILYHEV
jgi:hypothetical protein